MDTVYPLLGTALLLSFVICCVASGLLQVSAWFRHTKEGAPVTIRALKDPEPYFDEIGVRQIRLARQLLLVGGVAYLSYGVLIVVASVMAG